MLYPSHIVESDPKELQGLIETKIKNFIKNSNTERRNVPDPESCIKSGKKFDSDYKMFRATP